MLKCLGCGEEFLYAAKRLTFDIPLRPGQSIVLPSNPTGYEPRIETHICPFCHGLDLREVEETQPIESLVQVGYDEVDAFLKKGYEVKESYASKVTMVKKVKEEKKI